MFAADVSSNKYLWLDYRMQLLDNTWLLVIFNYLDARYITISPFCIIDSLPCDIIRVITEFDRFYISYRLIEYPRSWLENRRVILNSYDFRSTILF